MKQILFLILITATMISCETTPTETTEAAQEPLASSTNKVVLYSEIEWSPLNPARGDQSPQAGTIWGDRNGKEATGFLVKFANGFSSPPHIHNVTYRGTVIKGLVHNDDPKAEKMWMPAGSFWTQPAGEPHITAANGTENIAYIEIDHGPYLVKPVDEAFDEGERPLNIDQSNIVWVNLSEKVKGPQVSYLWGKPEASEVYGMYLKLPPGFAGKLIHSGSTFHAVVIDGPIDYHLQGEEGTKTLNAGSYFSSAESSAHHLSGNRESATVIYVRTNGTVDVKTD
ncbi:DUF4437 domain-containing protein [Neolewinella agarilytica]|uniref:DUF4437 domain-containing protein n=1 Tax=Neolewinella agarilytica TaxID=478744 RepID=A0A1H8ZRH4_9BACT|nr:DUF4437 domain-containing protein [Neolewinella agarilytica]SEP66823.1 protein of unknown function [Neolewinella agarilytica]